MLAGNESPARWEGCDQFYGSYGERLWDGADDGELVDK